MTVNCNITRVTTLSKFGYLKDKIQLNILAYRYTSEFPSQAERETATYAGKEREGGKDWEDKMVRQTSKESLLYTGSIMSYFPPIPPVYSFVAIYYCGVGMGVCTNEWRKDKSGLNRAVFSSSPSSLVPLSFPPSPSTYRADAGQPKRTVRTMLGDSRTEVGIQGEDAQCYEIEDEVESRRAADFRVVANENVVNHARDRGTG